MVQNMSWDARITKHYETTLGLRGGYARKIFRDRPSSILNSEYIVSSDLGLTVMAKSGKRITPKFSEAHYNHNYGNPQSAKKLYTQLVKTKNYQKKIKLFKKLKR